MEVAMRRISVLIAGAVLASCTAVPPEPTRSARAQERFEALIAGKVARPPITCLPFNRGNDMVRIDEQTIAFPDGSRRVYINHMRGPCSGLLNSNTALVTRQYTSPGPCAGDIARVVDNSARMTVGSCAWGDFIPYETPPGS
jgi:hypothetical protein